MKKKCINASLIMIVIAILINICSFHIYAEVSTWINRDIEQIKIRNYTDAPEAGTYYYGTYITEWFNVGSIATNNNIQYPTVGLISNFTQANVSELNNRDKRFTSFIDTSTGTPYLYFGWVIERGNGSYIDTTIQVRYGSSGIQYYSGTDNSKNINNKYYDFYYGYIKYNNVSNIQTSWNIGGYTNTNSLQINDATEQLLYDLTFGELSIDPTPQINWGELEISYQQNIITDGNGALNEDIIRWNAYRDTAGNDLQGKNIEIQAIAGYFHGSSYADLKANNFTDWLNATHPSVTMYKGSIEKSYDVYEWGEVATNFRDINTLGMWFWNIFTSEETWYQYGWRYQARLLDEELEPLTEWQLIYTGNSWTPSATETFTDDEPLKPDDVETINDINDENGNELNWYINNTYITNNEYNQTYQQNIIENIYNILQGQPDDEINHKAGDAQNIIDNAIDTEDDYMNNLQTQLNDLELNDITNNNGLMKALRWVREVHHETIEETELGGIVLTIMLIGLITYLIGRRNG